uniref:Uncharacterized protein n=1 Tax=Hucho hucho TaxID=62062 RepID=A0A4W5QS59_9TELE
MLIKQNLISRTVGKAPMSVEREEGYPLLGREKEIEVYSSMLKGFLEARAAGHKNYNVLIYEGPIGYGKSRLLAEVVYRTAKDGVRLVPDVRSGPRSGLSNYNGHCHAKCTNRSDTRLV